MRDSGPVKLLPYRPNTSKQKLVEWKVEYVLARCFVVQACSERGSRVTLPPEPGGRVEIYIDIYPFPWVDDPVDRMEAATCMADFGFIRECWKVPWIESIEGIVCVMAGRAVCRGEAVPCSPRSALAVFRCLLGRVADGLQSVIDYLGEVVSCDTTWGVRAGGAGVVFAGLQGAGLVLTLLMGEVVKAQEQSLSCVVGRVCVTSSRPQVEASRRFLAPSCCRVLQRLQGVVVPCWWFVPGHSSQLAPLTDLLREGREWELGESCERAFCPLEDVLCSPPRLKTSVLSQPFAPAVDGSQEKASGCVS